MPFGGQVGKATCDERGETPCFLRRQMRGPDAGVATLEADDDET
jgi:hypothetical protein